MWYSRTFSLRQLWKWFSPDKIKVNHSPIRGNFIDTKNPYNRSLGLEQHKISWLINMQPLVVIFWTNRLTYQLSGKLEFGIVPTVHDVPLEQSLVFQKWEKSKTDPCWRTFQFWPQFSPWLHEKKKKWKIRYFLFLLRSRNLLTW